MKKSLLALFIIISFFSFKMISGYQDDTGKKSGYAIKFNSIPDKWDEGLPLGNGMFGALIWKKGNALRFALDRGDLWDIRTPKEFEDPNFSFNWVVKKVKENDYKPVQQLLDIPYDRDATPTKIPAGAIEFDLPGLNEAEYASVNLADAVADVKLKNGITVTSFVNAVSSEGWIKISGLKEELAPRIDPPPFNSEALIQGSNSGPGGNDLVRLGYREPGIEKRKNEIIYTQKCYGDYEFKIRLKWKFENKTLYCAWTISTSRPYPLYKEKYTAFAGNISEKIYAMEFSRHTGWWKKFWLKSSISIPDLLLEEQYYKEMYKFGSTSRSSAPPITLQAIWTADNRRLPPWKGDFHNDLNTQLSYWPSYSSNHPSEARSFTNWLNLNKPEAIRFTKKYFGVKGLNFAGVSTLTGQPMGGWIQYAMSPTVSAWLAHHFYLEWRYSMDENFLKNSAYPWLSETAEFITNLSTLEKGKRKLPLSSSPEINDNDISAWFKETTNYDLALIRWLYGAAAEGADALGKKSEAAKWRTILSQWPELATEGNKLLVAPGVELKFSHRHFSHLMSIHPLGITAWEKKTDREIINKSLSDLERLGTSQWCGYSYSWLGSLYARAMDGNKAAEALRIFASCFCSPNSFHLNGDQSGTGKSSFTYRPFTLEGNFAFAQGIQEMLLQSHNGLIKIFPAIPKEWKNASFKSLRTEGAFLISASMKDGSFQSLSLLPEKGGKAVISNPFCDVNIAVAGNYKSKQVTKDYIIIETDKGKSVTITKK